MSRIFPVFVPHEGCPRQCVFCDQKSITQSAPFSVKEIEKQLNTAFADPRLHGAQIAFFGGSFTALPQERMLALLDLAQDLVTRGVACSIRFSTRPDAMSEKTVRLLSSYAVTDVELGLQSLKDGVLTACRRGHDSACAYQAAHRILAAGWHLTGQMMLGLPTSSPEDERFTAEAICAMRAHSARVYPTVVFRRTPLGEMTLRGEYRPMKEEEAVARGAEVCRVFLKNGVKLLRVGLCDNQSLHSQEVLGGANLPSYGEQVYARIWQNALLGEFLPQKELLRGQKLTLSAHPSQLSHLSGYRKETKRKLFSDLSLSSLQILPAPEARPFTLSYQIGEDACRKKGFLDVLKDT